MPDGYPVDTEAWSGSLLSRWNFAFALVQGEIRGTTVDLAHVQSATTAIFGSSPPGLEHALAGIDDVHEAVALCLASPAYQWR